MTETVLEEKVSSLEKIMMELAYESLKTNMALRGFKSEMSDFKDEMKVFKNEMTDFKDEMTVFKNEMSDFKDEMKEFKNEMSDFKDEMKEFKIESDTDRKRMDKKWEELIHEMKEIKIASDADRKRMDKKWEELIHEMKQYKIDSEADRKQINKQWGDLANKMGTIVEDIVAPGLKGVARRYFNIDEFDSFSVRNRRRNKDRTMIREFDVIAETQTLFFVVETKVTPHTEYISSFIKLIPELPQWFPAIQEKTLVPVFASLNLPKEAVRYLTKNKIIAMATGDDGMEIYNPEILAVFQ